MTPLQAGRLTTASQDNEGVVLTAFGDGAWWLIGSGALRSLPWWLLVAWLVFG